MRPPIIGVGDKYTEIGGILVPPSKVEFALTKYCKQVLVRTEVEAFPYRLLGSGSGVRVGKRYFVLTTSHQLAGVDLDCVCLMTPSRKTTINPSNLFTPSSNHFDPTTDLSDVKIFEYPIEKYDIAGLSSQFFQVKQGRLWPEDSLQSFVVFGYPSKKQLVEYELPKITANLTYTSAKYQSKSKEDGLHCLRMNTANPIDADGFSGGPVFYLGQKNGEFFIGFAGMIVRGGNPSFFVHFLEADYLIALCENSIPDESIGSRR